MGCLGVQGMSWLCPALLWLAAVPCCAMPVIIPPGSSCPKERAEPTAWPHAGAFIRSGNSTHGDSQWSCGAGRRCFSRQEGGVGGGAEVQENLQQHRRGFCHSDKDLCRHTQYQVMLVLHWADNNKSLYPLRFIFTIRKIKGKKAKCLPILSDNLPVVEL